MDQATETLPAASPEADSHARSAAGPFRRSHSLVRDRYLCFLTLIVAGVVAGLLIDLPRLILQDTWLALVDGRQIARDGIPHHDVLTIFFHGHAWVDQQWLAQLWMYWLHQLGGLSLVGVVNVALIACGLAGAAAASIRLGAHGASVCLVSCAVAAIVGIPSEVRTQPYVYPLFVMTVYLLAADARGRTKNVYWCLPVLVVWANLHGSALLGAGLVVLRGLTIVWTAVRSWESASAVVWRRATVLIVGAPLALLATPYGTGIISYYQTTLVSSTLRRFVTEWQPVTENVPLAVMFFALASVTVWSLGRFGARSTLWERIATFALATLAISAVRNVVWFALAALILLPVWIDPAIRARVRPAPPRPRLNAWLLTAAGTLVAILALRVATLDADSLTPVYPPGGLAAVRGALKSHPGARVFADETYADWLLWQLPALRGRVAYDATLELLSSAQVEAIVDFKNDSGVNWLRAARGDRLVALSETQDGGLLTPLRTQAGARLLYDHHAFALLDR